MSTFRTELKSKLKGPIKNCGAVGPEKNDVIRHKGPCTSFRLCSEFFFKSRVRLTGACRPFYVAIYFML